MVSFRQGYGPDIAASDRTFLFAIPWRLLFSPSGSQSTTNKQDASNPPRIILVRYRPGQRSHSRLSSPPPLPRETEKQLTKIPSCLGLERPEEVSDPTRLLPFSLAGGDEYLLPTTPPNSLTRIRERTCFAEDYPPAPSTI